MVPFVLKGRSGWAGGRLEHLSRAGLRDTLYQRHLGAVAARRPGCWCPGAGGGAVHVGPGSSLSRGMYQPGCGL